MIYHITHEVGGRGCHKVARPVKNREELLALRNSEENLRHLERARQGDDKEKAQLVQLAYNLGHVSGRLAGCKSIGSHFFFDVDCYDAKQTALASLDGAAFPDPWNQNKPTVFTAFSMGGASGKYIRIGIIKGGEVSSNNTGLMEINTREIAVFGSEKK